MYWKVEASQESLHTIWTILLEGKNSIVTWKGLSFLTINYILDIFDQPIYAINLTHAERNLTYKDT